MDQVTQDPEAHRDGAAWRGRRDRSIPVGGWGEPDGSGGPDDADGEAHRRRQRARDAGRDRGSLPAESAGPPGGRGRQGHHHRSHERRGARRRRLQERGHDPDRRVPPQRHHAGDRPGDRGVPRGQGRQRGPHRPLQGEGRQDQGLGRHHESLREGRAGRRKGRGGGQGRPRRRRRRQGVPARLPGRPSPGEEPQLDDRPAHQGARDQVQPPPGQRRALAPGGPGGGARGEAEAHAGGHPRGHGHHRRREEHHGLRRVHRPGRGRRPAPHHRHVVGPDQPPLRARAGGRQARRGRPPLRQGVRPRLARAQAEGARSLGVGRGAVLPWAAATPARW